MKNKKIKMLVIAILVPLVIGFVSYLLTKDNIQNYSENVVKPALTPPTILFPIVWTILYVLMGISSYRVFVSKNLSSQNALLVYVIQLFFNFFWSIIFFNLKAYLVAFMWLVIMIILIAIMVLKFYKIDKLAGILQIPYLLWSLFAAYLNFNVYLLNM